MAILFVDVSKPVAPETGRDENHSSAVTETVKTTGVLKSLNTALPFLNH